MLKGAPTKENFVIAIERYIHADEKKKEVSEFCMETTSQLFGSRTHESRALGFTQSRR